MYLAVPFGECLVTPLPEPALSGPQPTNIPPSCKLPNVDPDNGYRHPVEPDRSLRKHREVDEGAKLMGCMGMQLTPLFSKTDSPEDLESWVEVGMSVGVLERGHHVYIRQ